jgi:hypothetical protein
VSGGFEGFRGFEAEGFCPGAWSETGSIVDQNWQTMMVDVARTVDVWKAAGVNEITQ